METVFVVLAIIAVMILGSIALVSLFFLAKTCLFFVIRKKIPRFKTIPGFREYNEDMDRSEECLAEKIKKKEEEPKPQQNPAKPGKLRTPTVVAIVIVAVLAFTNPSTADFKSSNAWNEGIKILRDNKEISNLQAAAYLLIQPGGSVYPIDRSSYLIFSTYTIDGIKFTGVFNMFFVHSDGKPKLVR